MFWMGHRRVLQALKDRYNSILWLWSPLCRRKCSPRQHSKVLTLLLSTRPTAGHDSWDQAACIAVTDGQKDDQTSIVKLIGAACRMLLCKKHGLALLLTVPWRGIAWQEVCGDNRSYSFPWALKEKHKPKNCVACFPCAKILLLSCSCGFKTCCWNKEYLEVGVIGSGHLRIGPASLTYGSCLCKHTPS